MENSTSQRIETSTPQSMENATPPSMENSIALPSTQAQTQTASFNTENVSNATMSPFMDPAGGCSGRPFAAKAALLRFLPFFIFITVY